MVLGISTVLGVLALAMVLLGVALLVSVSNARRKVICPYDGHLARIETDPLTALHHTFSGKPEKVVACSRWPERAGCDQACLRGEEPPDTDPDDPQITNPG